MPSPTRTPAAARPAAGLAPLPALLAVLAAALSPGRSEAQVTPTGPFTGSLREGFETQHLSVGGQHVSIQGCLAGGLFLGTAELCTPIGLGVYLDSQLTMPDGCDLAPHTGAFAATSLGEYLELSFDPPLTRLGGRFASFTPTENTVHVWLRDAAGVLIDVRTFVLANDCTWTWHGWESAVPIGSVQVVGDGDWFGLTGLVALDDLEADPDLSQDPGIGTVHCTSEPGSTGLVASLSAHGDPAADAGGLLLLGQDLPPGEFALACCGRYPGVVVHPGGGQGVLCLGLPFGRLDPPRVVGADGGLLVPLDTTALPNASPAAVQPGETWYFQVWYRDQDPGPTSNWSESIAVAFL